MAKKVLISGYIGFANFGDEAVLAALAAHLKSKDASVCALSSNPFGTSREYGIKSRNYMNIFDIFESVAECDILFSGGGSLLQNYTSNMSLFYYLFIIFLALFMRKKVVVFAQGIGPIRGFWSNILTKMALRKCSLVTVRDITSQQLLREWNISSKLVADPVWGMDLPERKPQGVLGIQLRPFGLMNRRFLERLATGIGLYFEDKKVRIFSFQNDMDAPKCYEFQSILKKSNPTIDCEVIARATIAEIVEDFSQLDYLIAMRFHACLLGLKYGIRTLPISYDMKVETLAKEFDVDYLHAYEDTDFFSNIQELRDSQDSMVTMQRKKVGFEWGLFDAILNSGDKKR